MAEEKVNWKVGLQYAPKTDVGMRRSKNQDSRAVVPASDRERWAERGHLFMVADGMGAHAAGELASKIATDHVPHLYQKYADRSSPEALQKAILEANAEVHRRGQANADFHNMGTTASVLVLLPQGALVGHVGDSRVYRLRGEVLDQLTRDHSLVWEMREQFAENAELQRIIPKNVITRSLGPNPHVQVDIEGPLPVNCGDVYLVCSDGLTGPVEDEELGPILASLPPDEAAQMLVDLANLRGGPDNITVIVVKVTDPEIATHAAGSDPITINADHTKPNVHAAFWVVTGVLLLAAPIMLAIDQQMAAAVSGSLGLVTWLAALLQRQRKSRSGVPLSEGRRLGQAPYTSQRYPVSKLLVDRLLADKEQLCEVVRDEGWTFRWDDVEAQCQLAAQATRKQEYAEAVRHYAHAIGDLMKQFRAQRDQQASDSAIDY